MPALSPPLVSTAMRIFFPGGGATCTLLCVAILLAVYCPAVEDKVVQIRQPRSFPAFSALRLRQTDLRYPHCRCSG